MTILASPDGAPASAENLTQNGCNHNGAEPIRFHFKGFSIWLDFGEQRSDFPSAFSTTGNGDFSEKNHSLNDDVKLACSEMAEAHGLFPIPAPHVTVLYGIEHTSQAAVREKFSQVRELIKAWPVLRPIGMVADVELDGVNGGTMDMSWCEITFASSDAHEKLVDLVHQIFHAGVKGGMHEQRAGPWRPHLSIAYDNPEGKALTMSNVLPMLAKRPSLVGDRKATGISLWSTEGTMGHWKLLDQIVFDEKQATADRSPSLLSRWRNAFYL
eukprot:CAMPEP_0198228844 /NCGR_PEP_ID=MMETSP1445-20131203/113813_1 /TAXON_ID=36898 /ORGANISM="Pyramimonas sp., Strain CCMP2087" /LENGTH=269 /DNA_ID=CAMNT_0043909275 /DNA_START=273 /DNA_END=1082 /DNA_ORIENTATION=-